MKIEWLVADLTAIRTPDKAEYTILVVILAGRVFCQSRSFSWPGSLMKIEWLVTDITAVGFPDRVERAI